MADLPKPGTQEWNDLIRESLTGGGVDKGPIGGPHANYGPNMQGYSGLSPGYSQNLAALGQIAGLGLPGAGSVVSLGNAVNGYAAQQQQADIISGLPGFGTDKDPNKPGLMDVVSGIMGNTTQGGMPGLQNSFDKAMASIKGDLDPNLSMMSGLPNLQDLMASKGYSADPSTNTDVSAGNKADRFSADFAPGAVEKADLGPPGGDKATAGTDKAAAGDKTAGGDQDAEGLAKGGMVARKTQTGGDPKGPDNGYTPTKRGEFVVRASAVRHYGVGLLTALNEKRVPKGRLGEGPLHT